MIVTVIEKQYNSDGTIQGAIDTLRLRGTNAALYQVAEKLDDYLSDFKCSKHPDAAVACTIEVNGDDLLSEGAAFETNLPSPCCEEFKVRFEAKIGEFFDQYRSNP